MKKTRLFVVVYLGVVGAALALGAPGYVAARESTDVPMAVPAGVTLVNVVKGGVNGQILNMGFLWWRLGDAHGNPLYTYDKDGSTSQSSCLDACAKEFPPFLAPRDAVASGDFSLLRRPDGEGKQWAYQGQPLYSYAGPVALPELALGYNAVVGKGQEHDFEPSSKYFSPKMGWRQAVLDPAKSVPMPADVHLRCLEAANGYAFVIAPTGMPLYILEREPKEGSPWTPFYAAGVMLPVGAFSKLARSDGTEQWAYKGQRLYTYNGDYSPSDINGVTQKGARIALAYRLFMPHELDIRMFPTRPPLMTTAKGLTVYTEARYNVFFGGRETRSGYYTPYKEAKTVGTLGCTAECTRTWQPVLAPANAQSWGLWEVLKRPDGARQWAYKGGALYTSVEDKVPGEIRGNNQAVLIYADAHNKITAAVGEGFSETEEDGRPAGDLMALTGGDVYNPHSYGGSFGAGFYWHIVAFY